MAFLRRIWNKWQNLLHDEKLKHKMYKEFRNKKEKGLSCRLTPYVFNLQSVNIQRNIMQQA